MAPVLGPRNERGTAALEGVAAAAALIVFTAAALVMAYGLFTRMWLQFQAEQALYCLAENRGVAHCRRAHQAALVSALPLGRPGKTQLWITPSGWKIETEWIWRDLRISQVKELSLARIIRKEVSR